MVRKLKRAFGFAVGDIVKLSPSYFEWDEYVLKGARRERAAWRRFQIIGFDVDLETVRVKRLDLASGQGESYHYTFLTKLSAGERY